MRSFLYYDYNILLVTLTLLLTLGAFADFSNNNNISFPVALDNNISVAFACIEY